jgi:hypothetical protein
MLISISEADKNKKNIEVSMRFIINFGGGLKDETI